MKTSAFDMPNRLRHGYDASYGMPRVTTVTKVTPPVLPLHTSVAPSWRSGAGNETQWMSFGEVAARVLARIADGKRTDCAGPRQARAISR